MLKYSGVGINSASGRAIMTDIRATTRDIARLDRRATSGLAVDAAMVLRMALAFIWLLDAALQYQPYMFSRAFSGTLSRTAAGNPAMIASPITWSAGIVAHYPVASNAIFATVQLLLALGILWPRTVKMALAGSVLWSVAIWWLGEGLGGVLTGTASPASGAPGAVILYALLAVVLWPAAAGGSACSFVAGRPLGDRPARLLWLLLWGALAYLAVQPLNRTSQGLHDLVTGNAPGEPAWVAAIDRAAAAPLAHLGSPVSVALAAVLAAVALGVFLPVPLARITLVLAVLTAVAIWTAGEDFGGIFTGTSTDPNTGPLLALLAACYWPVRR